MIKISLDPRTKLFMIFAVSFIVMVNAVTPLEWGIRLWSAAAVTRGLGAPVKRTSPYELKLKAADFIIIGLFAVSVIIFITAKYFR